MRKLMLTGIAVIIINSLAIAQTSATDFSRL